MHTFAIFIIISLIVLYVGAKVLTVAFEILSAIMEGTTVAAKNTPKAVLRLLGRRSIGATIEIDDFLANSDKSLRKKEIDAYKAYQPSVGYIQNVFNSVKYESALGAISKRVFESRKTKNISDIESILVPNRMSAKQRIEALIRETPFPLPAPKVLQQVAPPPELKPSEKIDIPEPSIQLPLWEGNLSKLNGYVFKEFQNEIASVENAKLVLRELKELEESQEVELKQAYASATSRYQKAIDAEKHSHEYAIAEWAKSKDQWVRDHEDEQNILRDLLNVFSRGEIEKQVHFILDSIDLPHWMPCNYEIKYDSETKILIVEHEYVDIGSIEWVKTVQLKSGPTSKPLNQKELKHVTDLLYPSITLRIAYELAHQLSGDVEAIAINGWADYTVKATGNTKRAYCSSLLATTDDIKNLNLITLDPLVAFSSLNGNVARSLELTPISPKIKIDANDARYVEDKEVLGGLSKEQNLASMDWQDFEHLCRELFERLFASSGAVVKVTQASRDMGVDAVVHNADPILGGKIVIQAKRYVNTVDVSAVRDLWGTVNHEGAMKGILVTTSQYGPDSYAFIQNKPLQLINGNELLGLLEQYGYKFRINLDEARKFLKENHAFPFNKKEDGN